MYLQSTRFLLFCTIVFVAFATARAEEPVPSPQPAVRLVCPPVMAARDSVVLLRDGDAFQATGFVFGDESIVATAAHVAASSAVDRKGGIYALRRIAADDRSDIALYQADRPVAGATPLIAGAAEIGIAVFSVGHPNATEATEARLPGLYRWSIVHGMISGVSNEWVLADFIPASGASGSPLVTCDGTVVGVLSAYGQGGFTLVGSALALTRLYETRLSVASPERPNRFVAELGMDVDILNDQVGAAFGIAWVGEAIWGARLTSAISTNSLFGDLRHDGRVNLVRLSLDVLAKASGVLRTDGSLEFAVGAGWKRRWISPFTLERPTMSDDYLVPRLAVRYNFASSPLFLALHAEAEIGHKVEPSVWVRLGYRFWL